VRDQAPKYGFHPGTKIPRRKPEADHHEGRGTCKLCGVQDLVWEKQGSRWRLVDVGGKPHVCDHWGKPPELCPCCGVKIGNNYQTTKSNATTTRPAWYGFFHCIPHQGGDRSLSVCGGRINVDGSAA